MSNMDRHRYSLRLQLDTNLWSEVSILNIIRNIPTNHHLTNISCYKWPIWCVQSRHRNLDPFVINCILPSNFRIKENYMDLENGQEVNQTIMVYPSVKWITS